MSALRKAITENPSFLRWGAKLLLRLPEPLQLGKVAIVSRWDTVQEVLKRDLDFIIAPINKERIEYVNGPFILGMDRNATQLQERDALYQALRKIDLSRIHQQTQKKARAVLDEIPSGGTLDVVNDYARPIASHSATLLTGIAAPDTIDQMRVARAMFYELFLNLSDDPAVRNTAFNASKELREWCNTEIARRHKLKNKGDDMMGRMLETHSLDDEGIRRTLSGMFVGAIDTTTTCVAQILSVLMARPTLRGEMMKDLDDSDRMRGWCWEALRFWPHNPLVMREAAQDTEVKGKLIKKGTRVICLTLGAMHDSSAFPYPERADPTRPETRYLHFGGGFHPCAGRAVNGVQIPRLVSELLRRNPVQQGKVLFDGPFPDRLTIRLDN